MGAKLRLFDYYHLSNIIFIIIVTLSLTLYKPCTSEDHIDYKPIATAFFIFGDSTVDSGNNNYFTTTPENRADYKPYGQNGFFDAPTGRFSNGRIFVDFIAEKAKLQLIPPFMQPSADYNNGVNFASGGAGVLPETNQGKVIDLQMQLKNFEVVQNSLAEKLGDDESKRILSEAVYFISVGSNDYMGGYLRIPKMQELYQPPDYVGMVIGNLTRSIQVLYEKGARKFGFLSLTPLGCLPALRAANHDPNANGACFEQANKLAKAHNYGISTVLANLQRALKGFKYSNTQFYDWFNDRLNNPTKHGFKDGVNACCGTGPYGGMDTCGGTKSVKHYDLCDNPEDYVWWDSFHATEKIHEQLAKDLWDGPATFIGPYSINQLFAAEGLTIADIVHDDDNMLQF
ncbi:unnamed protein product [Rhodiola kirilowii]